jgi:carboxyl-terminal processing protease
MPIVDALDGNRQYFLASDIDEFEAWRTNLDDAVKRGRLEPVFEIYDSLSRAGPRTRAAHSQ